MTWPDVRARFGTTHHRRRLLAGLADAMALLARAGCPRLYLDGSFVTRERYPRDYDCCWEDGRVDWTVLDPVFKDLSRGTGEQKKRFKGEFYPAGVTEAGSGLTFREFFQWDRDGNPKGIVAINLGGFVP